MPPREQERLWSSLVHPDDHPGLNAALEAHLAGTSPSFEAEYRVKASDGSSHWIIDRGRVVEYGGHHRPLRMLGVCADVTERKLADQSLLASERRFRTMFDSGFQIKTLLDIDCSVLEANRTALDFIAHELAQIRGVKVWDTPWWGSSAVGAEQIKDACTKVAQGETVRFETEICGVNGRRAIVDFSLKPICDADGKVIQMLAECRDITDWQRSEDNLREMATLSTMGRLAAKVAHEINNPLAGIQNAFLLLKDAIPTTHPYYRYVGAIERETARIGAVTRQLYETYRPESDDTEVSSVPTTISDSVALLEQVNRSTGVTITIDAQRAPPVLAIPSSMLRQVIYNLVQNAIEASPPGGKVAVRAWGEPEAFWLTVSDQGPGITPELRERVFDEFGASKNTLRTAGMGLGLALVRRAVESVAGKVSVSDAEGGGAEFRVMIPIGPGSPSGTGRSAPGFRATRLGS
ncbi:MAG: ATP-binding protein, partial [Gemmatimonadota bacterium]